MKPTQSSQCEWHPYLLSNLLYRFHVIIQPSTSLEKRRGTCIDVVSTFGTSRNVCTLLVVPKPVVCISQILTQHFISGDLRTWFLTDRVLITGFTPFEKACSYLENTHFCLSVLLFGTHRYLVSFDCCWWEISFTDSQATVIMRVFAKNRLFLSVYWGTRSLGGWKTLVGNRDGYRVGVNCIPGILIVCGKYIS